ncbi:hypothetical protein ACFX13_035994 [Malus domestica]
MATPAGGRPLKPVAPSHAEEKQQANQQKPRVPELEKHLVNQLIELDKEILDAREKIEYFRVKMQELAGNLASKKELLTGMRFGIALKMKDSLLSRSSLLMCQMSWHLQNRNNHQLRKQKLPQLRVQQPLLHLKLMLSQKGLKVRMPRIWIRRVIRITTFPALGSSASTLSGLGHDKVVAFPKRAALLLSTILFLAHHSQPSIQGIHRQGTRIAQNLHLTPSLGLIRSEAHKILDFFLNQKHSEDLILCAAVEILIRVMVFQHLMTSQTLLALRRHLGHRWTVKLKEETQTPSDLQVHFGRHWTVKLPEKNQIFLGFQQRHLGHH